ncbi:IPT/TIG domain-containing protein [Actinoplanes subglobosus]|uniref:IPT/TIG domain-containing protein n=1 Tax=Actinoplanes subglobosus TaxID=1547892 RepID=A0ABV8IL52_9ACTN
MRKSKSRSKARLAASAGLTTGAVGAALLVAPAAAFAAVTVTPPVVAPGDSVTIVDTDATFANGTNTTAARVQILTSPGTTTPVCAATISTASATILATDQTQSASSSSAKSVTFKLPAGATAGTNGQAKKYVACVYDYAGGTTARQGNQNGYTINVGSPAVLNTPIGLTGGGNTLNVTTSTNVFTNVATIGAQFVAGGECASTYGTPVANLATTVNKTADNAVNLVVPAGVVSTSAAPAKYSLCFYNGAASSSALITGSGYSAGYLSLSQGTGPWQGGNAINITSPNPFLAGIDDPGVTFEAAECAATYTSARNASVIEPVSAPRKVTNSRLAVTVPAPLYADQNTFNTALGSALSMPWNLCVYGGVANGQSALIASHPYRVTTVQTSSGVTPKAGPALGGSLITVTGTAFPTTAGALSATLGGTPLTEITPISTTAFTARTPRHAPASNVSLVVTTAAGSHTLNSAFSYTSAVVANPKTAPNTRPIDVIVNGVGFEGAPWSNTVTTGAHIFLSQGSYSNATVTSGGRATPPVADCNNVLVLSDTELVCRVDLTKRLNATGTAVLTGTPKVAAAINTTTGSRVVTGDGTPAFTQEDVGKAIIDSAATPKIPSGTVITAVISSTEAVMSNPASGALVGDDTVAIVSANSRVVAGVVTTNGDDDITGPASTYAAGDVGSFLIAAGVPDATTLLSVGSGTAAVLSANATAGATVRAVIASPNIAVPEGSYNLQYVSNAALNAVHTDTSYVQSAVSSASTFTVSAF